MAKKKFNLSKWGKIAVVVLVIIAGVFLYSIIKPYLSWKTYIIDNFISFRYPSDWHFQVDNYTMLSGEKYLFLVSDFDGELSRQDFSSPDQKFLVEGDKIVKHDSSSFDEYIKPILSFCDDTRCLLRESKFRKNGFNVDKITIIGNKKTFYKREYFYFIEGKDYIYQIRVGYNGDVWLVSNPLRKLLAEKIISSIDYK